MCGVDDFNVVVDVVDDVDVAVDDTLPPRDCCCDVCGIGYQYAEKLKKFGVQTAFDLTLKPIDFAIIHLGGVLGLRLWRELKGITSMNLGDELINKKMIATTRMF